MADKGRIHTTKRDRCTGTEPHYLMHELKHKTAKQGRSYRSSIILIIALLIGLQLSPSYAQMAEILREEFHKQEELGLVIVTPANVRKLPSLLNSPEIRIIALQVEPGDLTVPLREKLIKWVREGHSLLIYDHRILPYFGMQPFILKPQMFRWKPESGSLGGKVVPGVATVALALKKHPINTGVGQCTIFLRRFGDGEKAEFGAVAVKGDTVPLLQFTIDSPALCAMRRDGKGMIVYKPLLWPKALSGDRFQSNLLEFAAGFKIPGPAGTGRIGHPPGPKAEYVVGNPAVPLGSSDTLESRNSSSPLPTSSSPPQPTVTKNIKLWEKTRPINSAYSNHPQPAQIHADEDYIITTSGHIITGRILTSNLHFETTDSSIMVDRKVVSRIDLGASTDLDQLKLRDGRVYKGLLLLRELVLSTPQGEQVFSKESLKEIGFKEQAP